MIGCRIHHPSSSLPLPHPFKVYLNLVWILSRLGFSFFFHCPPPHVIAFNPKEMSFCCVGCFMAVVMLCLLSSRHPLWFSPAHILVRVNFHLRTRQGCRLNAVILYMTSQHVLRVWSAPAYVFLCRSFQHLLHRHSNAFMLAWLSPLM